MLHELRKLEWKLSSKDSRVSTIKTDETAELPLHGWRRLQDAMLGQPPGDKGRTCRWVKYTYHKSRV